MLFELDDGTSESVGEGKDTTIVLSFASPSAAPPDLFRGKSDFTTAVLLPGPPVLGLSVEERLLSDFPNEKLVYSGEIGGRSFLVDTGGPLCVG
jgi:hypothetical protein